MWLKNKTIHCFGSSGERFWNILPWHIQGKRRSKNWYWHVRPSLSPQTLLKKGVFILCEILSHKLDIPHRLIISGSNAFTRTHFKKAWVKTQKYSDKIKLFTLKKKKASIIRRLSVLSWCESVYIVGNPTEWPTWNSSIQRGPAEKKCRSSRMHHHTWDSWSSDKLLSVF